MKVTSTKRKGTKSELLFQRVKGVWEAHCGVSLPLPPDVTDTDKLKEFCVGLLESPENHPWSGLLRGAGARKRLSVAASLFLFRKALPVVADKDAMYRKHREAFVPACRRERQPLPEGYLHHVRRLIREEMKEFDKGYRLHCWSTTPSVGSCTSVPRSKGGTRALRNDRAVFLRRVIGEEYFEVDNLVKYCAISTAGKMRGVTIASDDMGLLAPLHRSMYDAISARPWLLRGEAKPGRFRAFTRKDGEVFVSGDYESASDNLRVEVADCIIDTLQSMSTKVPSTVWEAARAFLRCKIQYPDLNVPCSAEGQLMGNLLCFPLLCLQNYAAFRWCLGPDKPVRINGDDIVFRATRAEYEHWADFVSSVGLVLSRGKTLVSRDYFSLNSAFFWAKDKVAPRAVPVTRVGAFVRQFESWGSLSGSFNSFLRGYRGAAKLVGECVFLSHFKSRIKQSGRSTRRGLGIFASIESLIRTGLWKRECWYFDSVAPCHDQLPEEPSRLKWGSIPQGWKRVPASSCLFTGVVAFEKAKVWEEWEEAPPVPNNFPRKKVVLPDNVMPLQRVFFEEVAARTWTEQPTRGQLLETYKRNVLGSGWEYAWRDWKKPVPAGLRRLFASRRRVNPTAAKSWVPPPRVPLFWAPYEVASVEETDGREVLAYGYGAGGGVIDTLAKEYVVLSPRTEGEGGPEVTEARVEMFRPPLDYTPTTFEV